MIVAHFLHLIESFTFRRHPRGFLAFSWLLGLGVGGLVFRYAGESIASMMLLAAAGQLSIVSLFLCTSLPFLLCATLVHMDKPGLLLPVCFCRAFLYAYALCGVFAAFDGFGWLVRWLLLFSATFGSALLYAFAQRHISGLRSVSLGELAFWEICLAVLAAVDYFYISPFLRQLLS